MGINVTYPANPDEWYAKGTLEDGTYFEVPAKFNPDGSCDKEATDAKIAALIEFIKTRP